MFTLSRCVVSEVLSTRISSRSRNVSARRGISASRPNLSAFAPPRPASNESEITCAWSTWLRYGTPAPRPRFAAPLPPARSPNTLASPAPAAPLRPAAPATSPARGEGLRPAFMSPRDPISARPLPPRGPVAIFGTEWTEEESRREQLGIKPCSVFPFLPISQQAPRGGGREGGEPRTGRYRSVPPSPPALPDHRAAARPRTPLGRAEQPRSGDGRCLVHFPPLATPRRWRLGLPQDPLPRRAAGHRRPQQPDDDPVGPGRRRRHQSQHRPRRLQAIEEGGGRQRGLELSAIRRGLLRPRVGDRGLP